MQAIWCYASQSIIFGSRLEQQQQKYERNRSAMRSHTSSQPANHPANLSSDVACNRTINICSMQCYFIFSLFSRRLISSIHFLIESGHIFCWRALSFSLSFVLAISQRDNNVLRRYFIQFHLRGHIVVCAVLKKKKPFFSMHFDTLRAERERVRWCDGVRHGVNRKFTIWNVETM